MGDYDRLDSTLQTNANLRLKIKVIQATADIRIAELEAKLKFAQDLLEEISSDCSTILRGIK